MWNAFKSFFSVIVVVCGGLEKFAKAFALSGEWAEEGMQGFVDQAKSDREIIQIRTQAAAKVAKARAIAEAKAQAEIKEVKAS